MKIAIENGKLYVYPEGRISAENADAFERELSDAISAHAEAELVIDAAGLEYISSSGLRVLLRRQQQSDEKIMNVEKALRFVSIEGLEQIGAGARSAVYRLDGETILKVVKDMTLDAIHSEVKVSKDVLIYGIPTAISYDVVRTEGGYGEDLGGMFRFEKRMN